MHGAHRRDGTMGWAAKAHNTGRIVRFLLVGLPGLPARGFEEYQAAARHAGGAFGSLSMSKGACRARRGLGR
jgi:hypothetical protein